MANTIKCPKCGEVFQVDESGYAAIVKQIRDEEFFTELNDRKQQFESEKTSAIQVTKLELEKFYDKQLQEKENTILKLKNQIDNFDKDKKLEISEIKSEMKNVLAEKENCINKLNSDKELIIKESQLNEKMLKDRYENALRFKDEELAQYKDFKAKLSTKMIGESLEQHCEIEFNKLRATAFQNAYFEKDNDAKSGSKGDFIYREAAEDEEFISIMFEMKNEADTTSTKKKNEDFFKELDKDRKEKKCEYAVLVSMLEPENEFYNTGIVDVSHRYEKMYVIRPQFFIPIITLLRNASLNSLEYRKELSAVRNQNIDIAKFEAEMNDFKDKFSRNYQLASKKFKLAIEEIDKTIDHLQKTKEALISSENNYRLANDKAEDLSIKRLAKHSPTILCELALIEDKKLNK